MLGKQVCILCNEDAKWYSPLQFQTVGGKGATKNWKRSITHNKNGLLKYMDKLIILSTSNSTPPPSLPPTSQLLLPSIMSQSSTLDSTLEDVIRKAIEKTVQPIMKILLDKIQTLESELKQTQCQVKELQQKFEVLESRSDKNIPEKLEVIQATVRNHQRSIEMTLQNNR